jgi:hypothetical protein
MPIFQKTLITLKVLPKWAIALLIALFLFFLWFVFGSAATGNPLTMNETITYEADGLFVLNFTAEKSFNVEWELIGDHCFQKPTSGYYKIYFSAPDFLGTYSGGFLINKNNLNIFHAAGNCGQIENYIAGNSYTAYLMNDNNPILVADDVATIKANRLRDKDIETDITSTSVFTLAEQDGGTQWNSNFYLTYTPTINIVSPLDDSELTSVFEMLITYGTAESFERAMIIFENWDAESTCPISGSAEWETEYPLYFNYQSMPYFSPQFSTSTGTTTISVSDLSPQNFKCVRCYMVSESTGQISGELCPDYNISVLAFIPPETQPSYYFPISDWADFYATHTDRWATSTALFNNWAEAVEPMMTWIGNLIISFQEIFNASSSAARGAEYGNAIPVARGYLATINNFFGGLPISTAFLFYLITALVVIIFKLISSVINLIKP